MLPVIAAAPTGHDQNAFLISFVEEFLCLQFTFEPDRVQTHVLHVAEFVLKPLRVLAQHHVGRPAAAANQDSLAIDTEDPLIVGYYFRRDFTNSEM